MVIRVADQEDDLWLWDVMRLTLTRLTFNPGADAYPVWTPDGRRLIFNSQREGSQNLFWQAADGTGAVERLTKSSNIQNSSGVSPDGTRLIFTETAPATSEDVMQVELIGTRTVTALVQSPVAERNGIIAPDGRWLAYEANDSGQFEIYVRPYPSVNGGRWQVSTGGGTRPVWSRTGEELFYASPAGAILRVNVERGTSWAATTPATVVKAGYVIPSGFPGRFYDVSSDGQRFLVVKSASDPTGPPPQIVIVQHFDEELKRLVPTN
jgi:serine/threonine-protein kinase